MCPGGTERLTQPCKCPVGGAKLGNLWKLFQSTFPSAGLPSRRTHCSPCTEVDQELGRISSNLEARSEGHIITPSSQMRNWPPEEIDMVIQQTPGAEGHDPSASHTRHRPSRVPGFGDKAGGHDQQLGSGRPSWMLFWTYCFLEGKAVWREEALGTGLWVWPTSGHSQVWEARKCWFPNCF